MIKDRRKYVCMMMEKHHAKQLGYFYPTAIHKVEAIKNGIVSDIQYSIGYDSYKPGCFGDNGFWNFIPCFRLNKEDGEMAVEWLKAKKKSEDARFKENQEYKKNNYTREKVIYV